MKIQHFITSRFNINTPEVLGRHPQIAPTYEEWARQKLLLLEHCSSSSLQNQTCQDFEWICFCDSRTPEEFRSKIEAFEDFETVYVGTNKEARPWDPVFISQATEVVKSKIQPDTEIVIETRMDIDDCVRRTFVERVRQYATKENLNRLVNFTYGLHYRIQKESTLFLQYWSKAPFLSVIQANDEKWKSVWTKAHIRLDRVFPALDIDATPMWMQTVYETNATKLIWPHKHMLPRKKYRRKMAVNHEFLFREFGFNPAIVDLLNKKGSAEEKRI